MDIKRRIFGSERASYHHGNLKDALIDAARQLVAERGPSGFTLAEAAKRVGVTGAAPYRHFADRSALMQELAVRGFARLNSEQRLAWRNGQPDPTTAFRRMGAVYLAFAKAEPGLYSAMFSSAEAQPAQAAPEAQASFDMLVVAVNGVLAQHGAAGGGAAALASEIWSLSHGVAMLALNGFLSPERTGSDPGEIQQRGVSSLIEMAIRRIRG